MRWEVKGADRETGKDVRVEVDADTEAGAAAAARARGMLVASVRPIPSIPYARGSTPKPAPTPEKPRSRARALANLEEGLQTGFDDQAVTLCRVFAVIAYLGAIFGGSADHSRGVMLMILGALWGLTASVIRSRATTRAVLDALSRQAAADKAPAPRDGDPGPVDPAELRERPRARPPS